MPLPPPPAPQVAQTESFWVAQVTTAELDTLEWEVESGDRTVVVMNGDASRGIDLDASLGFKVDTLLPVAIGRRVRSRDVRSRHCVGHSVGGHLP